MTMRVVVVDDEPPARRKMLRLLAPYADVAVVGEAGSGDEAVRVLGEAKPDVVFLDVQLPDMDGFEVLRRVPGPAPFRPVFVTAFDAFAVKAFEADAIDYLLKPVDARRFDAMLTRARAAVAAAAGKGTGAQRFLVTDRARAYYVPAEIVDWLEADRNYVVLHAGGQEHVVRGTLDAFARSLEPTEFVRISRSHVVRRDAIVELLPAPHGERVVRLRDGAELGWTRRFRE
jgi:two-component system, LytTR family, response regulator